jgi:hypothetical protein
MYDPYIPMMFNTNFMPATLVKMREENKKNLCDR